MCMSNVERSIGLHRSYSTREMVYGKQHPACIHLIFMFSYDFNAKKIIINIYGNSTETILKNEELMITRSLIC